MLIRKKFLQLSLDFNFFFSKSKNLFFLKNFLGVLVTFMPSFFFFKYSKNNLIFTFLCRFFFISFYKHFVYNYKRLLFFNFFKLRIKGLGYRIKKIANNLLRFFFTSINFFYFHVPVTVLLKVKKKRIILLSNDLDILKKLIAQLLLLKKLSGYRIRGLIFPRQIILLRVGKRSL